MAISDDPDSVPHNSESEEKVPMPLSEGNGEAASSRPEPARVEPEGWRSPGSWESLLYAIKNKDCTPFLGAGASAHILPLGRTIAEDWATEFHYPFSDSGNLPRVAQYVTFTEPGGQTKLRYRLQYQFAADSPKFDPATDLHRAIAELGLPVFITTNYDSFMTKALIAAKRPPLTETCQWHNARNLSPKQDEGIGSDFVPTPRKPVVFHLHGDLVDLPSMVLTEDDYLNFLINTSQFKVIPSYIEAAFGPQKTFLFMGYSLEDLSFKVLFRRFAQQITQSPGDRHVAVQLHDPKGFSPAQKAKQRLYLEEVFKSEKVRVYWGDVGDFARSLLERWKEFKLEKGIKDDD